MSAEELGFRTQPDAEVVSDITSRSGSEEPAYPFLDGAPTMNILRILTGTNPDGSSFAVNHPIHLDLATKHISPQDKPAA